MQKFAIIVAGGKGSRMQSETPKQFLLLNETPILMHTISAFHKYDSGLELIVVLPSEQTNLWHNLVKQYKFTVAHEIVVGGSSRFDSVKNGLTRIKTNEGLVAIHDGARPLVSLETIHNTFRTAQDQGNAIAAVDLKDSLRKTFKNGNKAVDRSKYKIIQTPQTFDLKLIKEAFSEVEGTDFTDDASVLEQHGRSIHLVDGDYSNLKITTPGDLKLAESILNGRK